MTISKSITNYMTFKINFDQEIFAPPELFDMGVYNHMFLFTVVSGEDYSSPAP